VFLVGDGTTVGRIGRLEVRSIVDDAGGDEAHGIVEELCVADGCGCETCVALVSDPGIAVVVVLGGTEAFGQ
jgi:hypothetical protein